jgi:hypothetical protein
MAGVLWASLVPAWAAPSLLDSDPEVVYTREFTDDTIELLVVESGPVYSTKKGKFGGTWLGQLKKDTKVELVGFNETAYQIRGTSDRGGVSGWVSPKILASKDKDFIENFKKVYQRQIQIRELIAKKEIAIGMTMDEVSQVLGRPTKTTMRQTAKGQSGQWEYIEFEEISHYQTVIDPVTRQSFRRFSHITREETSKLVVEFENDVVNAIEESEQRDGGRVKIVVPPVVFGW